MSKFITSVLIACLIVLAGILWASRQTPESAIFADLSKSGLICDRNKNSAVTAVKKLASGTIYEGKVFINEPPTKPKGSLYVYFVCQAHQASEDRSIVRNCAYIARAPIILCDATFFESFCRKYGLWDLSVPFGTTIEEFRKQKVAALIVWVLGHEFGHVISSHSAGQFRHFGLDSVTDSARSSQLLEYEADAWLAKKLATLSADELEISAIMFSLITNQLHRYLPKDRIFPGVGLPQITGPIIVPADGTHPEFILRAVRFLSITLDESNIPGSEDILEHVVKPLAASIILNADDQ